MSRPATSLTRAVAHLFDQGDAGARPAGFEQPTYIDCCLSLACITTCPRRALHALVDHARSHYRAHTTRPLPDRMLRRAACVLLDLRLFRLMLAALLVAACPAPRPRRFTLGHDGSRRRHPGARAIRLYNPISAARGGSGSRSHNGRRRVALLSGRAADVLSPHITPRRGAF